MSCLVNWAARGVYKLHFDDIELSNKIYFDRWPCSMKQSVNYSGIVCHLWWIAADAIFMEGLTDGMVEVWFLLGVRKYQGIWAQSVYEILLEAGSSCSSSTAL